MTASSDEPEIKRHPLTPSFGEESTSAADSGFEVLVGFIGDSPREPRVRIYADLSFQSYAELEAGDVLHTKPVDPEDEDGPVVVTVAADAQIEYVLVQRLAGDAAFVAGTTRALLGGPSDDEASRYDWSFPPHPPVTPVLYCVSRVYPPCPEPITLPPWPKPLPPLIPVSRVYPPC